jgi:hypothetical protein
MYSSVRLKRRFMQLEIFCSMLCAGTMKDVIGRFFCFALHCMIFTDIVVNSVNALPNERKNRQIRQVFRQENIPTTEPVL